QPAADYAVYFGRENASKFYQNVTYEHNPSTSMQPLVLNALSIPEFSGDTRSFPMFRNHFLETVEGRKDLTPRQKFMCLLQHLDDEHLQEASSCMATDANYFTAIDVLEERYGNKHLLIHASNRTSSI
ncbi:hypothetical protein AAVH_36989, partial [Aphelenchoides avenae]